MVESIFSAFEFACLYQRFVGVGEAYPSEIRHPIRLHPQYVVQNPKTHILKDRSQANYIVIAPDHPEGTGVFQYPSTGAEPGSAKIVIFLKTSKAVSVVVDRGDFGHVRQP